LIPLGFWSGRSLRAATISKAAGHGTLGQSAESPNRHQVAAERSTPGEKVIPETGEPYLIVLPDVIHRIEVKLMDGIELNRDECRLLGMTEAQIQQLAALVHDTVKRWQDRETAAMISIPTSGTDRLYYIPPGDPALMEQDYQAMNNSVREIAGPDLTDLIQMRLSKGYSPQRMDNSQMGLLNVLTGGFGSMSRFIRGTQQADGQWQYEESDFRAGSLDGAGPVDEALFQKIGRTLTPDQYPGAWIRDKGLLSHLSLPQS